MLHAKETGPWATWACIRALPLVRYEGVQKENEDSGRRNFQFQEKFT